MRALEAAALSAPVEGSSPRFGVIVDTLAVAVLVFRRHHLVYANLSAQNLAGRLREKHKSELTVLLRDHLHGLGEKLDRSATVSLLTAGRGEPFYVHVTPLDDEGVDVAVTVRELGTALSAFRSRYRLSPREGEVVELVLLGYRNRVIATTLGVSPATIKKHLTHVFDKVGVDTRTQLVSRLA
jgi:DNA-binding CsgD family transcriptional regulator